MTAQPASTVPTQRYLARAESRGLLLGRGLLVLAALYPLLRQSPSLTRQFLLIAIYSIVALGLNVTLGYAGEFAIGQAGLFAVGAYTAGMITGLYGWSFWVALPIAIVSSAIAGVIIGAPGLRVGGWYFALSTLVIAVAIPDFVNIVPNSGGVTGFGGIPYPTFFGRDMTLSQIYILALTGLAIVLLLLRNLVNSGWGLAFVTMRENSSVAESLGISVRRMKLVVYVLSAMCAGFAGALFAHVEGYLAPSAFPFSLSIMFVAAVVIGGLGSLAGSIVGVALIQILPNIGASFEKYALLVYGVLLVVTMYFIPDGAVPSLRRLWIRIVVAYRSRRPMLVAEDRKETPEAIAASGQPEGAHLNIPLTTPPALEPRAANDALIVEGASKHFGEVHALRHVSMTAGPGAITAVIGSNGSGKTTLLNVILGFYRLDSGSVRFGSRELTNRAPWRIARAGVARTFQTPVVLPTRSVLENVAVGMFVHRRASFLSYLARLPKSRRDTRTAEEAALALLDFVGLRTEASLEASSLAPGQQRLLEIARALIAGPRVLLLDEPAAGLIGEEIDDLALLLKRIEQLQLTVVLVEHNVQLVTAVAAQVVVLHNGEVIATGTPDVVQRDAAVVAAYLGTEVADVER